MDGWSFCLLFFFVDTERAREGGRERSDLNMFVVCWVRGWMFVMHSIFLHFSFPLLALLQQQEEKRKVYRALSVMVGSNGWMTRVN